MKVYKDQNPKVLEMMFGIKTAVEVNPEQSKFVYSATDSGEIAGVFFFDSNESGNCFAASYGFLSKWCTKELIISALSLAFTELGNKRITAIVDASNLRSIKLNLRIGFKVEGVMEDYGTGKGIIMGLLRRNVDFSKIFKR